MKVTRIKINSYRGIEALETSIPPHGAIVKGANGQGKSSVLNALRAALAAKDIAPDAIRIGADKAEILVDLDDVSVRRVITQKGSTLTVEKAGMKASKPTTYLTELLGGSPLDPLDLFLAKPKERKAIVLAALPVTVTREQVEAYAGDFELPLEFSTDGHGLEVIERARKYFYDERTAANKEAAEAKRNAERLDKEAKAAAQSIDPGPVVPDTEARVAIAAAERELMAIEGRAQAAADAESRTLAQRERIAVLLRQAADVLDAAPGVVETEALETRLKQARAVVFDLEHQLDVARERACAFDDELKAAQAANEAHRKAVSRAEDLRAQANALGSAIEAATVKAPSDSELTTAQAKVREAHAAMERATQQKAAFAAVEAAEKAKEEAKRLAAEAEDLDAVVKRLANDAPNELLTSAQAIPGLSLDGDEVLLDGKRLDALCGAEQMKFAVEVARRANAKTKLLIVDGLERLDPEQMEAFVQMATADGFQLLATRVASGQVVIEAIEGDAHDKAAE